MTEGGRESEGGKNKIKMKKVCTPVPSLSRLISWSAARWPIARLTQQDRSTDLLAFIRDRANASHAPSIEKEVEKVVEKEVKKDLERDEEIEWGRN